MVLLASAGLSSLMSSWPRMQSGQKNPFQNAPGPFIYALPNLASACPFSCSDTVRSCAFSGESIDAPDPHPHHDHNRCCHCPAVTSHFCQHSSDPSSESESETAGPPTAPAKESAPDTGPQSGSPLPPPPPRLFSPLSPSDESHFDLGVDISSSSLPATERETTEPEQEQEEQEGREKHHQASKPSTPTYTLSSLTGSDFPEGPKEEVEEEKENEKTGERRRGRNHKRQRRRGRGRPPAGENVAPRFMGLSGIHYGLWTQYVCPQALPLFPETTTTTTNHHQASSWSFASAGYHHHHDGFEFAVPPNSCCPAPLVPQFWNPVVPAPVYVGVPVVAS